MDLTFVKRAGKFDDLTIRTGTGTTQAVTCPKQGIIPHDMVHYAVECVLSHRGFLSLVKQGAAADFATTGDEEAEAIERLVETFQAELWGGRVAASDLIASYEHACMARGHAVAPISADDVDAIRVRLDELTGRWAAIATGDAITLHF